MHQTHNTLSENIRTQPHPAQGVCSENALWNHLAIRCVISPAAELCARQIQRAVIDWYFC